MADRRADPRIPVQFQGTFSIAPSGWAKGTIVDLAVGGCCIESPTMIHPPSYLQLSLVISPQELPLVVDLAVVRWAERSRLGVKFLIVQPEQQMRLIRIIERDGQDTSTRVP